MNGWIKRSLSPWSAGQDDATSVLSESVEERKMPFHRKREDGSYVKNTILKRIYKDFGSLSKANKNPYYMTYTKSTFPTLQKRMKAEIPPGTLISAKYEPYKPKGTPRYSKIDKFIDNLNQACAALPKPLIEDFGRGRPHAIEVQSQPKAEVRMIRVRGSEPTPAQTNAGEQEVDQASLKSPIKSGVVPTPGVTQIVCASPEMGPWKVVDEVNHAIVNCGRQATKPCSGDAFESKKEEVVRAATMLQARYRGYKVRRSQPLRSMLMIGGAKSKLEELKQQFTAWKIAVWFPTDYSERLAMTENVTNLLTELHSIKHDDVDTSAKDKLLGYMRRAESTGNKTVCHLGVLSIPELCLSIMSYYRKGVPPYIKEFRKSVTRDVLKFQDEVDTFLRHKSKQRAISDSVRKENTQRPKSRTERWTGNCNLSESASLNELRDSWKTVELSSTMQREFGPGQELSGVLDTNEVNSADVGESEESDEEDTIQRHQLQADFISPMCPDEVVGPQEDSTSCPRPSNELEVEEENGISHGLEHVAFDIFIPAHEDSSRTLRKKKYGVRFEDLVSQREIDLVIKPCSVTEESVLSPEEESSCHTVPVLMSDHEHYITSSSSIQPCSDTEQSFHSAEEGSSSLDAGILMSDYRHIVESSCSNGSRRTELTDILEQRGEVYPSASISMPVAQNLCPRVDAEDEAGSREQESQFGCIETAYEHAPRNTVAVHVHSNEEPNCLDFSGDVHVHGQLKYQSHMDGTRNTLINGATTIPTKSRFHNEQSHLWTSPHDGSIRSSHSHVHYEGSCNSSDSATCETSEGLDKLDEHERNCEVFRSEGAWSKVPPLEQKQMVTLADQATDLRALRESPRLRRNCGDSPSMRMCSRNALDKGTSNAEEVVEGIDGVQDVDKVSCCSDCARPQGRNVPECWKPTVSIGEEEICLRLPCNEYPREVQESYIPLGFTDAGSRDEYHQSPKREDFCGFDHRELRYAVDPYTWKLRRVRQATQTRRTKNDSHRTPCPQDLEKQASTAVQHVPKAFAHKATSYTPTPSPSETICSQAEISYPRCRSHSPSRRGSVHEERRAWEPDEVQTADRELLTKLADDNKRLKRLLKDVMNWNKAQATAMVSMSERIGHLEGLDNFH